MPLEITTGTCIFPVARVRANASFLLCRKQSPGCRSDAWTKSDADKAEGGGGPGWDLSSLTSPTGLKELKGF